jgi:hypothetical protein
MLPKEPVKPAKPETKVIRITGTGRDSITMRFLAGGTKVVCGSGTSGIGTAKSQIETLILKIY